MLPVGVAVLLRAMSLRGRRLVCGVSILSSRVAISSSRVRITSSLWLFHPRGSGPIGDDVLRSRSGQYREDADAKDGSPASRTIDPSTPYVERGRACPGHEDGVIEL
jgi:hypothetical protein